MEALRTLAYSVLCGAAIGLFSIAAALIGDIFDSARSLLREVMSRLREIRSVFRLIDITPKGDMERHRFITDFTVTLMAVISISLLLYIAVDGMIRLYVVLPALLTAYAVCHIFADRVRGVFGCLVRILFSTVAIVLSIAFYPFYGIVSRLVRKKVRKKAKNDNLTA
ncbi:MAG: hypothetical protein E7617_03640 [Ruminococcaceae bacterium]|nr:hypothetical protein [Oscillospiraceae bacterium]